MDHYIFVRGGVGGGTLYIEYQTAAQVGLHMEAKVMDINTTIPGC